METSTWCILIGIVLWLMPIPPFGMALGTLLIGAGLAMRWLG